MVFKICDTLMRYNYLLDSQVSTGETEAKEFQNTTVNILTSIIISICGLMGLVSVFWAVWCTIGFFRAKDGEKRDEAKKKLVYSVVAVIVTALLIVILMFVKNNLPKWMGEGEFFPKQ